MTSRGRWLTLVFWVMAIAFIATMAVVYHKYDPSTLPFPRCPFKTLTGFECPGCGSQRAIHALLNGDIVGAWSINAFLVLLLPFMVLLMMVEAFPNRLVKMRRIFVSPLFAYSLLILVLAWWIGRNIF